MFILFRIELYEKGFYDLMKFICKTYENEIIDVFNNMDGPLCIIVDLPNEDEEDYKEEREYESEDESDEDEREECREERILNNLKKKYESKLWDCDTYEPLYDEEYFRITEEENQYQTPKIYIYKKDFGRPGKFILSKNVKRLIKISLHFNLQDESKIEKWNDKLDHYHNTDYGKFMKYCFSHYPKYDNIDFRKLYLLDKTLNGLYELEYKKI